MGKKLVAKTAEAETVIVAAPDLKRAVEAWLTYLEVERQLSANTSEAYARDITHFLAFLAGHLNRLPTLAQLKALAARDVRAFLASRRAQGVGSRSLSLRLKRARWSRVPISQRLTQPSGSRRGTQRYSRFSTAQACASLRLCRLPSKTRRSAVATCCASPARATRRGWFRCFPSCARRSSAISRCVQSSSARTISCSSACAEVRSRLASSSSSSPRREARLGSLTPRRRMRCGTLSPRICSAPALTYAQSRSCSDTRAFRPRRAIPRSTASSC